MATIGLYDIDLHHGKAFSISLPLMQAYARLKSEGHQVIMMKPYEKTGRYNQIFYFKDNPKLEVPKKLVINQDKGKFCGFGFYGTSGISSKTMEFAPSFEPYDLFSNKIKNITLYKSIRNNSIIDWREKNFAGAKGGAAITYVTDRNFLNEEDWEEIFDHYDNNIDFIHSLKVDKSEEDKMFKLLKKPYGNHTRIVVPWQIDKDKLIYLSSCRGVVFNINDAMELTAQILISKILDIKLPMYSTYETDPFILDLIHWNNAGRISFKEFLGINWDPNKYITFPYRLMLQQDPTKITYDELCEEYFVK